SAFSSPPRVRDRHYSNTATVDFDAIFIPDHAERASLVIPFLSFYEVPLDRVQLLGLSTWQAPEMSIIGGIAEGAIFPRIYDRFLYGRTVEWFTSEFEARYERTPTEAEAQAFDVVGWLAAALSELPNAVVSRALIVERLQNTTHYEGLTGLVGVTASGAVRRQLAVFRVGRDGSAFEYQILR
ncbi:MAG: hypothetical protein KC561_08765, partial [Myxococcales bacterium]|nr:hypothetical protein [Myxococcales bacterium]